MAIEVTNPQIRITLTPQGPHIEANVPPEAIVQNLLLVIEEMRMRVILQRLEGGERRVQLVPAGAVGPLKPPDGSRG